MVKTKEEKAAQKRGYYEKNKDKIAAYNKAYKKAHKEQIKACNKARYQKNKEEIKANEKIRYQKNKEKKAAYKKIYNQTPGAKKSNFLTVYRNKGVDFQGKEDEWYDRYLDSTHCELCGIKFINNGGKNQRCFDHDHYTNLARNIICMSCNGKLPKQPAIPI